MTTAPERSRYHHTFAEYLAYEAVTISSLRQ
jgi:hypothetical protein